ncbi:MAG: S-adenosylmethionine-dependent methyltransferase [Promethearchaeota archaeon]|nr:MAG: S-adenosylmethionine-dependent methyltransferase [Candidatus Lokiarchaeota archaeon]
MPICKKCMKESDLSDFEKIDGEYICCSCLYQNSKPFKIYPIGFVSNSLKRGNGFGLKRGSKSGISKINLFESQKPFLYKLEDEKRITVIYYLHKSKNIRSIFPRGMDRKRVGIFASRTPDRPSHIGVSNVDLRKIEGTTLFVRHLDAIDGTPVLDIKLGGYSRW